MICNAFLFMLNHLKLEKYQKLPVDNIKYLVDNNINIWVGDMYKTYLNYINNPEIEDEVVWWCIDDPKENRLRAATEEEFIQLILKERSEFGDHLT